VGGHPNLKESNPIAFASELRGHFPLLAESQEKPYGYLFERMKP
jgi:hypothetical protein